MFMLLDRFRLMRYLMETDCTLVGKRCYLLSRPQVMAEVDAPQQAFEITASGYACSYETHRIFLHLSKTPSCFAQLIDYHIMKVSSMTEVRVKHCKATITESIQDNRDINITNRSISEIVIRFLYFRPQVQYQFTRPSVKLNRLLLTRIYIYIYIYIYLSYNILETSTVSRCLIFFYRRGVSV